MVLRDKASGAGSQIMARAKTAQESSGQISNAVAAERAASLPFPTPCLPDGAARFAADPAADPDALMRHLLARLQDLRTQSEIDPFSNPILMLALEITRMVDRAEITPSALEQLIQRLTGHAFLARADRLARYLGERDPLVNAAGLRQRLEAWIADTGADFDAYAALVERVHYGIVFTAHPTFSTSLDLSRVLAHLADGTADAAQLARALRADHRPPKVLTLSAEHQFAGEAIANLETALDRMRRTVLDVARSHFPGQWHRLSPRLVVAASWVGYDLDGRADIGWADTLVKRLKVKLAQLERHRGTLARLLGESAAVSPGLATTLELAVSVLTLAAKQTAEQLALAEQAGDRIDRAQALAESLVSGRDAALTDTTRLTALLDRALVDLALVDLARAEPATGTDAAHEAAHDLALDIAVVRASLAAHGLSNARCHFRLNATQLHNAIRREIDMETAPSDPVRRRSYFNALNERLDRTQPVQVNLGALIAEPASAKRMFMLIATILKHVDSETPIRFLIAETETGFTLLTALYLARLFGVEERVEISPLFETVEALERGEAVIEEALRSPHYRAYIRKQGRIAVQFGYSDSGRYIGQMAATFWIERLRLRLAGLLARHDLAGIEVILFNTHGESIGRGGHPASLSDRLHYLAPEASRREFTRHGLFAREESSFQGGDGYLPFLTPDLAFAALTRVVEFALPDGDRRAPRSAPAPDPIYGEADFATEFFAAVKQFFCDLVDDPHYAALLGVYGTNMLYRMGSRPVKRQHEGLGRPAELSHPSQLRAIPNNAVLQQLGLLANTISGLGAAMARDPDTAAAMLRASPRFRRALRMVQHALAASDLECLSAYVATLNPGMWLNRSAKTRSPTRREELRIVADRLEQVDLHQKLIKVFRKLQGDLLSLKTILDDIGPIEDPAADSTRNGVLALAGEDRERLVLLHTLRIALMHRIFLLATHIPDFSPQHGTTLEDIFARIIHLDVEDVVDLLSEIFPARDAADPAALDFAEPSTYRSAAGQTYEREHEQLFEPMKAYHDLIRRISVAVSYQIGAIG